MKSFNKKLNLNKVTIDILDDKALQNIKGGSADDAMSGSCFLFSCNRGGNNASGLQEN